MKKDSLYGIIITSVGLVIIMCIFVFFQLKIMHVVLSNNIPSYYYQIYRPEFLENPIDTTTKSIKLTLIIYMIDILIIIFIRLLIDTRSDKRHLPKQMVWMKWKPNYQIVPRGYFDKGIFAETVSSSSFEKCGGNSEDLKRFLCHDFHPKSLGNYDFILLACVVGYIGNKKSWYKLPLGDRVVEFCNIMDSLCQW